MWEFWTSKKSSFHENVNALDLVRGVGMTYKGDM
jgi:hypothetical protein